MSPGAGLLLAVVGFAVVQLVIRAFWRQLTAAKKEFEADVAQYLPGFNPWEARGDE